MVRRVGTVQRRAGRAEPPQARCRRTGYLQCWSSTSPEKAYRLRKAECVLARAGHRPGLRQPRGAWREAACVHAPDYVTAKSAGIPPRRGSCPRATGMSKISGRRTRCQPSGSPSLVVRARPAVDQCTGDAILDMVTLVTLDDNRLDKATHEVTAWKREQKGLRQ